MKLTKKQLILIVGITTLIIAGGLVGVVWYYSQNKGENVTTNNNITNTISNTNTADSTDIDTSDWLTYTNSDLGLTLKYPTDWNYEYYKDYSDSAKQDLIFGIQKTLYPTDPARQDFAQYSIKMQSSDGLELGQWIEKNETWLNDDSGAFEILEEKMVKLAGKDSKYHKLSNHVAGGTSETYYVLVNDKVLTIDFQSRIKSGYQNDQEFVDSVFEIINNSISFEDNNKAANLEDWQKYTNSDYGFSIKYPSDWNVKENENTISISAQEKSSDPFQTSYISISSKSSLYPEDACLMQDKTIILNNKQYRQQEEGCSYAGSAVATFFPSDNNYIVVSWTTDVEESFDTYEAMLSTFRLVNVPINSKTDSTMEVSGDAEIVKITGENYFDRFDQLNCQGIPATREGWLTYFNSTFGYSLQYPKEYAKTSQSSDQVIIFSPQDYSNNLKLHIAHFDDADWLPPIDADTNEWVVGHYLDGDQWGEKKGEIDLNGINMIFIEPEAPGTPLEELVFVKDGQMFKLSANRFSDDLSCEDWVIVEFFKSFHF